MRKKRVFIVEDDKIVALDVKSELEAHDYEIAGICGESRDVVRMVADSQPDIILMDVNINGDADGIELASIIMERYNIPVIYVTSYSDAETLRRSRSTHPYGYVLKPYEYITIIFSIEMALSRHYFETKYQENSRLIQTVFNSMNTAVLCVELDGKISVFNEAALGLFSMTDEELSEKIFPEFFEMYTEDGNTKIFDFFKRCSEDDHFCNGDITISVKGVIHVLSMNISPVYSIDGSVQRYVVMFTDVTDKKKEQREKIRTQKLESLSILAGGIAHDFNNILTSIIGNISLLKISGSPKISDPENIQMMDDIEKSAVRAQRLTSQLFTFSRGNTAARRTSDISVLLRDVAGFVLSGSNVTCTPEINENLHPVEVDEGQISQVMQNLLVNAMQTMPDGGEIYLKAGNVTLEKFNEYLLDEGEYIIVSVRDRGCGIKPDILSKIFDPYFSTKTGGSGMGLASSLAIIRNHSGYIGVNSEENKGSEFYFLLPKSEKTLQKSITDRDAFSGRGYILFLDDEENIRTTAAKIFRALGFDVIVYENFEKLYHDYRELILKNEKVYGIILDYTMPGDEYVTEAVYRLRKIDPETKIIISSGYTNDTILTDYAKYGFNAFLGKPYTVDKVRNVLKFLY